MPPLWDKPGTTREQIDRRSADDFEPYRDRLDTLTEARTSQPWYRRAWAWLMHAHKLVTILAAISASTVAAHAYIAGLITKDNLKDEVRQAVAEAMLDTRGRVTDLELHTAGLPDWRRDTQDMITRHDAQVATLEKRQGKLEDRFDSYLRHR